MMEEDDVCIVIMAYSDVNVISMKNSVVSCFPQPPTQSFLNLLNRPRTFRVVFPTVCSKIA